jgi:hypothetical protein
LKKWKFQGKAVEMTLNSKRKTLCQDFAQEFGLSSLH